MPPISDMQPGDEVHKVPVIGIIYPPPEVRNIVDKTASFVARNGPEFETRICQNEVNNPKFNFLNPQDPYHAYYQHKVKEFKEGKGLEPMAPKAQPMLARPMPPEQLQQRIEPIVPKEPPPEFEFIADPPSISAFDLDVVKLTAQFVARNGRQFLTNLMNREKNYQFDFLRPQHSLFNYFTKLVEQYTKVLIPPKDLLGKLGKESENPKVVLDQVRHRVEWARYQEREKRKEEEALERERVAYAQIDWHDFVVVEEVDIRVNEEGNFPPPTTPEEVGARLLAQERFETTPGENQAVEMDVESSSESEEEEEEEEEEKAPPPPPGPSAPQPGDDTEIQDMEEDSEEEIEEDDDDRPPRDKSPPPPPPPLPPPPPKDIPQPPPLPPQPDQVLIRKDYDPKAPKMVQTIQAPDKFLVSPITGEKISADKIQEHMRIGLLDPKWLEQRDRERAEKREQEEVYAAGSAIGGNLKLLAERRTDIFGSGAEEAQIGKKIGEEDKKVKEKVTWDGHTASMERVTQKARENISIEEQIAVIHKVKGLLPDEEKEKIGPAMPKGAPPPPQSNPRPPPPPPPAAPPPPPSIPAPPKPPVSLATMTETLQPPLPPPPTPVMMQAGRMMVMPPRPPMPPQMRHPQPPPQLMMGGPMGLSRPPMPPGLGPPMGPPGTFMQVPQPPQMPPRAQLMEEEPPTKRQKTEESLMPEEEFLRRNKAPVMFKVMVPNMPDKSEWKLNGQGLTFTLPLTDAVSVIKAKLHEVLGMPAGKQKLQYDGLFIKDSNTLAYYNFTRGAIVQLQLKERGGRKK